MRMTSTVSTGDRFYHGTRGAGGIDSHMFAKDGETLYLVRHPTCVFHSSVQMAHPLKTCSHIHPTFHLLLITAVDMASLQKMKGGYCLLSSSAIRICHLRLVLPRLGSAEVRHGNRRGTPNPGIPDYAPFNEEQYGLDAPGNPSSTTFTSHRAERLRLSNTISITPDCSKPCHTLSSNRSPIRLLPTKCPAPMDFTYAPARESRDRLYIPRSQP